MCYHRWVISPDTSTVAHQERTCFNTTSYGQQASYHPTDSHDVIIQQCRPLPFAPARLSARATKPVHQPNTIPPTLCQLGPQHPRLATEL